MNFKRLLAIAFSLILSLQSVNIAKAAEYAAETTATETPIATALKYPYASRAELITMIRDMLAKYTFEDYIKKDLETIVLLTYEQEMYDIVDLQLESLNNLPGYGVHIVTDSSPADAKELMKKHNNPHGLATNLGILIGKGWYSLGLLAHEFAHNYLKHIRSDIFSKEVTDLLNEGLTEYHVSEILKNDRIDKLFDFDKDLIYCIIQHSNSSGSYLTAANTIAMCDLLLKDENVVTYFNKNGKLENLFLEIEKDNPDFINGLLPYYLCSMKYSDVNLNSSREKIMTNKSVYDFSNLLTKYNSLASKDTSRVELLLEANEILRTKFINDIFDNINYIEDFKKAEEQYLLYRDVVALDIRTNEKNATILSISEFPSFEKLENQYQSWKKKAHTLPPAPIKPVAAQTPTPAASAPVSGIVAVPTASTVLVYGNKVPFDAYNIDGSNYFKLRDLAHVLSGTGKQFDVSWDSEKNAINLITEQAYTVAGSEMASSGNGNKTAIPTTSKVLVDGNEVTITAYNIGGNNYFKLRDIAEIIGFSVDWDAVNSVISIGMN